jgi:hypothetical protein
MKKIILTVTVVFMTQYADAQNTTFNNVSIGTEAPAFGVKINVNSPGYTGGWARQFALANENGNKTFIALGSFGGAVNGVFQVGSSYIGTDWDKQYMTFLPNGNVGVGTTSPSVKLDVDGALLLGQISSPGNSNGRVYIDNEGGSRLAQYNAIGTLTNIFQTNGNSYINGGNVGIGTIAPQAKLDVASDISNGQLGTVFGRLEEGNTQGNGTFLGVKGYTTYGPDPSNVKSFSIEHNFYGQTNSSINFYRGGDKIGGFLTFNTSDNSEKMRISANGNVGIGTTTPVTKLTVSGSDDAGNIGVLDLTTSGGTNLKLGGNSSYSWLQSHNGKPLYINQLGNNVVINSGAGNVGIGTTNPDSKLTVNGNIHAKEVKIDLSIPAPDYVFSPDYKLKPLQEVEEYINENNHLPEIPSAKELEKNGLMLAEMNMSLLKKVEELTLYIIEQNKRIEKLEMCNH